MVLFNDHTWWYDLDVSITLSDDNSIQKETRMPWKDVYKEIYPWFWKETVNYPYEAWDEFLDAWDRRTWLGRIVLTPFHCLALSYCIIMFGIFVVILNAIVFPLCPIGKTIRGWLVKKESDDVSPEPEISETTQQVWK
jgi:hypothetical protein